jgi:hypothetical protein
MGIKKNRLRWHDFCPSLVEVIAEKRVAARQTINGNADQLFQSRGREVWDCAIAHYAQSFGSPGPPKEDRKLAKTNYQFEKRKRESVKKAKKEEKRLRKLAPQDPVQPPAETKQ